MAQCKDGKRTAPRQRRRHLRPGKMVSEHQHRKRRIEVARHLDRLRHDSGQLHGKQEERKPERYAHL